MYREEGFAGFMKGNGINCARVSARVGQHVGGSKAGVYAEHTAT